MRFRMFFMFMWKHHRDIHCAQERKDKRLNRSYEQFKEQKRKMKRHAERQSSFGLSNAPPRITLRVPLGGPEGSCVSSLR